MTDYKTMYECAVEFVRSLIHEANEQGERIRRLEAEIRELRAQAKELRFNPNHDPENGRFTSDESGGKGVDFSAGSGIISVGNAMAEIQNSQISSEIAFAKDIRVDPEGVEIARTFIQNKLGIANPDLRNLKNAEVAQPFLEEIGAMQEKYGKAFSHIEFYNSTPDDRMLAETLNGTLRLNIRFFNDSSATQQLLDY